MVRVWFNHWFSTSYSIIEMMKRDAEKQIYVIGSNRVYRSVISQVCDEWYEEPDLDGEEYIDFCVEFCREHEVDVFVPRRKMVEISRNMERFHDMGVKVMVDEYDKIEILNNKAKTYELFAGEPGIHVPDFAVVTNIEEFERVYGRLSSQHPKLCIKFVNDEGGLSFRVIVQDRNGFDSLMSYPSARITISDLRCALSGKQNFKELMIMPFLSGKEISVDCLQTAHGLISVPRYKGNSRDEEIIFDKDIIRMCEKILEVSPLQCPCNIQFKLYQEIPYLLEINTRMSGGVQMSCLGAHINIPNIALNKLLGNDLEWTMKRENSIVSYIEIPKVIV